MSLNRALDTIAAHRNQTLPLTPELLHSTLSEKRRRQALRVLVSSGRLTTDEIADEVARNHSSLSAAGEATESQREAICGVLRHSHLPELEAADLVTVTADHRYSLAVDHELLVAVMDLIEEVCDTAESSHKNC